MRTSSEFIAQYYALLKTEAPFTYSDIADYANALLSGINIASDIDDSSKQSFAMACSYLLACDNGNILLDLEEIDDVDLEGRKTEIVLRACLEHLHKQLQTEKPWEITEAFISELGSMFIAFKVRNSLHFT